jgi:integrase
MSNNTDRLILEQVAALRGEVRALQDIVISRLPEPQTSHQTREDRSGATIVPKEVVPVGVPLNFTVQRYLNSSAVLDMSYAHHSNVVYTLSRFCSWAGSRQLDEVDKSLIVQYRDKSRESVSAKTVNNHLAIISSFFKWAQEQSYCNHNPAEGLALRVKTRRSKQRKAFSREQMSMILRDMSKGHYERKGLRCWLPLIMAYSGARPEEIAQLRVGDIRPMPRTHREPAPIWAFDFETEEHGQRRKSEASRRLVPIAGTLIQLGLLDLVKNRPKAELVWPAERGNGRGRLAESASRWFNRVLRSYYSIDDPKLVLYSIRHSFATTLKQEGVDEAVIAQILGHEHPNITNGRYGKDYRLDTLHAVISSVRW